MSKNMKTSDLGRLNKAVCTVRHPEVWRLRELFCASLDLLREAAAVNSPPLVVGLGYYTLTALSGSGYNGTPLAGE